MLDSSINIYHAAFNDVELKEVNFIKGKRKHYWCSNPERHGTMVVGIVSAYAPKAKICLCCVSEDMVFVKESVIAALEYLCDRVECQDLVIVMSFGCTLLTDEELGNTDDTDYRTTGKKRRRLINDLVGKGAVCIAAVGNRGLHVNNIASPAYLSNVIAVGGLDKNQWRI